MNSTEKPEIKCLNHGFVALDATFGEDRTPATCARTSYRNRAQRTEEEDAKLTRYLLAHRHTTPLEFNQVRFYMKMPIFVARQLVRHRTASINEVSLRYVQATREFYIPDLDRMQKQSETNKQGSSTEIINDAKYCRGLMAASCSDSFDNYEDIVRRGLSKELARTILPLGTYTEWYWQCDLHNTLHMLKLRLDSHAQYEIRVYAEAMFKLLSYEWPMLMKTWAELNEVPL